MFARIILCLLMVKPNREWAWYSSGFLFGGISRHRLKLTGWSHTSSVFPKRCVLMDSLTELDVYPALTFYAVIFISLQNL